MIEAAAIAAWILSRPAWIDRDLTREQRAPMVQRYAEAIASEARTLRQAAMVIAHGYEDTKFAYLVLVGRCGEMPRGQRCDGGRARGALGLHESACPKAWRYAEGSAESIREEVRCTLSLLSVHGRRCQEHALTPMIAAFGGMGGAGCHAPRATEKALLTRRIVEELGKAEAG